MEDYQGPGADVWRPPSPRGAEPGLCPCQMPPATRGHSVGRRCLPLHPGAGLGTRWARGPPSAPCPLRPGLAALAVPLPLSCPHQLHGSFCWFHFCFFSSSFEKSRAPAAGSAPQVPAAPRPGWASPGPRVGSRSLQLGQPGCPAGLPEQGRSWEAGGRSRKVTHVVGGRPLVFNPLAFPEDECY